jgi:hypothetical protein
MISRSDMASTDQLLWALQLAHRGSSVRFAPTTLTDLPTPFAPASQSTVSSSTIASYLKLPGVLRLERSFVLAGHRSETRWHNH